MRDAATIDDAPAGEADPPAGDPLAEAMARDLDRGFVDLFETYQGLVFSVALRVSGRRADAEDLSAEAFLRAYRALAGYPPERIAALRVRPWLLTIVMNLRRNRWRSDTRRPPPQSLDGSVEAAHPDRGEGVEDAALRHETGGELAALLGSLPEEQRAAVVLRHVVDLPVSEVATAMGLPPGTVKSHVSRGLRRLRALTSPEEASTDDTR